MIATRAARDQTMALRNELCERIVAHAEENGMSRVDLAAAVGIHRTQTSQLYAFAAGEPCERYQVETLMLMLIRLGYRCEVVTRAAQP